MTNTLHFMCVNVIRSMKIIYKNIILVDPASSYMLVSKIKPCMSKYTRITVKPQKAHYISYGSLDR